MSPVSTLSPFLLLCIGHSSCDQPRPQFSSDSDINTVVQDVRTGRIYLGAVNAIYQLDTGLRKESMAVTGPKKDHPSCTPPITAQCTEATETDNINKLLLVNGASGTLVACGSIFRGICALLNLSCVEQQVYYSDAKGEKTYVATTDKTVAVVGVISHFIKDGQKLSVFLVGKGYSGSDGSKLISTRLLQEQPNMDMFENVMETSTVQTSLYVQRYQHDFRHAFAHGGHIYFLFSRAANVGESRRATFAVRLCENDDHYYSYTELQLNCSAGTEKVYNRLRAVHVAAPGRVLARRLGLNESDVANRVLFAVFGSDDEVASSALCIYPLSSIDRRLEEVIESCYRGELLSDGKPKTVYSPYSNDAICKTNKLFPKTSLKSITEFLPSPLASRAEFALTATPSYFRQSELTSVAVSVKHNHTVAFLGTSLGEVFKVHLANQSEAYGKIPGDGADGPVNRNMFFDSSSAHLFITTSRKITKVPVQTCEQKKDCGSCVQQHDPYCGWCVLQGRCTIKEDCRRGEEKNTWLWSPNHQCIDVPALPSIVDGRLKCIIGAFRSGAVMRPCTSCDSLGNSTPLDFVTVPVKLVVDDTIEVAASEFKFYNCTAVVQKAANTPCSVCVKSEWRCQWNMQTHTCGDLDDPHINLHEVRSHEDARSPDGCPRFENPEPALIPVGFKIPISFHGKNLEQYRVIKLARTSCVLIANLCHWPFTYNKMPEVNVTFYVKEKGTEKKIDSTLQVGLYNCSVGREDCSLCKNADEKYNCVWCDTTRSCIYQKLCPKELRLCPSPSITDIVPRYGPTSGQIQVTIKGSNLGMKKEDIKRIVVAGVPCKHMAEKYSVSTRYAAGSGLSTPLLLLLLTLPFSMGVSNVLFTYRDPVPETVHPTKGPAGGGTVITISGQHLDTATKDDISVTVGTVPCELLVFGPHITCRTGPYKGSQIPSDPLRVTVKYGTNMSVEVPAFTYAANPKVTDYFPRASFFVQEAISKNDTALEFLSPAVNKMFSSFRTVLQLDNFQKNLTTFEYHPDPTFFNLTNKAITAGSIIIINGQGLSKAMTVQEAQAFVGDEPCNITILQDDKLFLVAPLNPPKSRSRRQRRDASAETMELVIKFGNGEWNVGTVHYEKKNEVPLYIIIPAVILPMLIFIAVSVYCYRRKSQQAEREYEKVKHQLESLEESVRDRCKKEFTDLMIEMEDHTSDMSEARIPFLDYKTYTNRVFFLPSKDGANDVMITGKLDIPEKRRAIVDQALNQFSNLLNSKTFLINFIRTLESRPEFNARSKVYFASLLTVALHGKLEYYTDIMRTLLLELMEEHVHSKNPKLMLRRSETVVERMLCNWMSICLYQFLKDSVGEPLYKLFKAIKHQVEKGPVDSALKKAKYTLNDTGLLGDDVEYCVLTLQVLVHGEGPDVTPVKVLNCDTISQVKEKIIEQVYRNLPYSQRPTVDSVALEWRPGSTGQILSDLDLTSQKEGRWKRLNTLAHYNVRDNATLVLSRVLHTQQSFDQNQDSHEESGALLEDDKVFHLVRPAEELDEIKSKRGSMKDKATTKAITEIYLTRLLSMKGTLQQFVDDFFRSVLCSGTAVPPAVKYFFDFLDEQAHKHDNVDEETIHIWKTNSLPLRFWVNILKNPHFIFDVHVTEVVDASLSVIAQTFMDACTKSEHKLSRVSPNAREGHVGELYYKGIRQMVPVSDQDMNTHLAEISRSHTDQLNTQVALHQLYRYASKYYDGIISSLEEDPAAQSKQLTLRLQQIAAALENKVTDL
uniref:Sema domain-containing protein n=1 Tax=Electrophorus electricus TaxID=8005 RepID=A0A4W4E4I0_ELEEL